MLVVCENIRIQNNSKSFYSSRDKAHDDAQVLQIGVTMARLWPLLSHRKFFMKYQVLQCFILKILVCVIMSGFRKSGHKYSTKPS